MNQIWDILLSETSRPLTISEAGKAVTIPMIQAMFRSLTHAAVKGEHRSQRLLTSLLHLSETQHQLRDHEAFETAIAYKRAWDNELGRRRSTGVAGPDPIPHPDHIDADWRTGHVRVAGPMTGPEKLVWDRLRARRSTALFAIAEIKRGLALEERQDMRQILLEEFEYEELVLALVTRVIAADAAAPTLIEPLEGVDSRRLDEASQQPSLEPSHDISDLFQTILHHIAQGRPLHVACDQAGLAKPSAVRLWLVEQPGFVAAYRQACQLGLAAIRADVAAIEEDGLDTPDGRRARARKWRMVEFPPEVDRQQGHTTQTPGEIDVSALSHDEQDQLLHLLEKSTRETKLP